MNVGIINLSRVKGEHYAQVLSRMSDVRLIGVYDPDDGNGRSFARKYDTTHFHNLDRFLEAETETVMVCAEAGDWQLIKACVQAEKHILCELSDYADAELSVLEDIQHLCRQKGKAFQFAYPMRFSPSVLKAKDVVQRGLLGQVAAAHVDYCMKTGEGNISNQLVHSVDLIQWIIQSRAKRVFAELDPLFGGESGQGCGVIMMEFESGTIASIDPSCSRPKAFPKDRDIMLNIVGTRGKVSVDLSPPSNLMFDQNRFQLMPLDFPDSCDEAMIRDLIRRIWMRTSLVFGSDELQTFKVIHSANKANKAHSFVAVGE